WPNFCVKPESRQDHQLRARVEAIYVISWIGFGESRCLRLLERRVEGGAGLLDLCEDKVTGPVQDASDLQQAIAAETFVQARKHRNAPCYRRAEQQVLPLRTRKFPQLGAVMGHELLVCGHHRLA